MNWKERYLNPHLIGILILLVAISALAYFEEKEAIFGHFHYLYFIPIVWAAWLFGLGPGLYCSLAISSIYFPLLAMSFMDAGFVSEASLEYIWGIVLFNACAVTVGKLAQRSINERRRYQTLYNVSEALNSRLSEDALLDLVMENIVNVLDVERGALILKNHKSGAFELRKTRGLTVEEEMLYAKWLNKKEPCLAFDLIHMQEPIINNWYEDERQFKKVMENSPAPPVRNFMAVPLILKDGPVGIISVENKRGDHRFSNEDLSILTSLSNQAMKAVENARLYEMGIKDALTGLYIRRFFLLQLDSEIRRIRRYGSNLSVVMIDIDHFKEVNDTLGHSQGDIVLRELASVLNQQVRDSDIVARYGGEEFTLLLPETDRFDAEMVAERIRSAVERHPFPGPGPRLHMTVSLGVAEWKELHHRTREAIIDCADIALLKAKREGRNRVVVWEPELSA